MRLSDFKLWIKDTGGWEHRSFCSPEGRKRGRGRRRGWRGWGWRAGREGGRAAQREGAGGFRRGSVMLRADGAAAGRSKGEMEGKEGERVPQRRGSRDSALNCLQIICVQRKPGRSVLFSPP